VPKFAARGCVYVLPLEKHEIADANRQGQVVTKYAIALQNSWTFKNRERYAFVLATSQHVDRLADWKVIVPAGTVQFWDEKTAIDCSCIYMITNERIDTSTYVGQLPTAVLEEINEALLVGLEM
jgi:mRNA-degrading endonuclease toxin of MazEF toxin-antitoxin module